MGATSSPSPFHSSRHSETRTPHTRGGASDVDLVQLSRSEWRVLNVPTGLQEPRLLGYIEEIERGQFEILWMDPPIGWAYVTSLDAAVIAFDDRDHFAGVVLSKRVLFVHLPSIGLPHHIHRRTLEPASVAGSVRTPHDSRAHALPSPVWAIIEMLARARRRGFHSGKAPD